LKRALLLIGASALIAACAASQAKCIDPVYALEGQHLSEPPRGSDLIWPGATPGQLQFMQRVFDAHVAWAKSRNQRYQRDIPPAQLVELEPDCRLLKPAAQAAQRMIAQARTDLAAAQARGDKHARQVADLGMLSAYRATTHQVLLWQNYFKSDFYPRTADARAQLPGGPHGKQAVEFILRRAIIPSLAPPGYSNHNRALAIDFRTREAGREITSNFDADNLRAWQHAWLLAWLKMHAHEYGFHPYPVEPWHWEYAGTVRSR
jgi:LAS superfamily LD-carboxypeptidase LdcB